MPSGPAALSPVRTTAVVLVGAYAWLTGMVLPGSLKYYSTIGLLGCLLLIGCLSIQEQLSRRSQPIEVALAVLLVALYAVIAVLSPYGVGELSQTVALFAACLFVFHGTPVGVGDWRPKLDIVYWAAVGALGLALFTAWRQSEYVVLSGFEDKNYSAILLFLFFSYCMKRRYWLGVGLSILYLAIDPSRIYILMMVVFWAARLLKKRLTSVPALARSLPLSPLSVVSVFAAMLIAVVVASPLWAARMVGPDTAAYRTSLNDTSNAMRALGNVYGMSRIASDPAFLLYGYDEKTLGALGVASADRQMHAQYNSFRLVQPHHSVLNLVLKYGAAFTVVYLILLAWLLSPYLDARNLEFWLPYLIAGMFMHSLLSGYLLLLWVYVLSVSDDPGGRPHDVRLLGARIRGDRPVARGVETRGWGQ